MGLQANRAVPGIYINMLVGPDGENLTYRMYMDIADLIELYIEDDDFARKIDGSSGGTRRLLSKAARNWLLSDLERKDVEKLISRMRGFASSVDSSDPRFDEPAAMPLSLVGWSTNVEDRLQAHARLSSTNKYWALINTILKKSLPEFEAEMQQFLIFKVWREDLSVIGEIVFTEMCMGYTDTGVGMSYWDAGRNNATAANISSEEYMALQDEMVESGIMAENAERERKLTDTLAAYTKQNLEKMAEIELLKMEIAELEKKRHQQSAEELAVLNEQISQIKLRNALAM